MFDNKSTRIKTQAPTPVDELFFCPVTVCIDIWLRLSSYKQLVFHIYLHRFNILKIVTFNKLPCFCATEVIKCISFFFFLFETPVEINTWLLSFHQMHHTSLSSSSPQISLFIRKKILASVMSSVTHHYQSSYRLSVMSQRGIAPHCVLQLTPSVHFIEVQRMFSV